MLLAKAVPSEAPVDLAVYLQLFNPYNKIEISKLSQEREAPENIFQTSKSHSKESGGDKTAERR